MDFHEFQRAGYKMINYIVEYNESLPTRSVTPTADVGFLKSAFPTPPEEGESFEKIMEDVEKYIMPGLTHWQHPGFHGFSPATTSYPAILALMLADCLGYVGLNWNMKPSESELEKVILDWYGKLIGLPDTFLPYSLTSKGAATIMRSKSECLFACMANARRSVLEELQLRNPSLSYAIMLSTLVAYCPKELDSWIVKCAKLSCVHIRVLETDEDFRLRGETLEKAIKHDKENGLIPFFACADLGSVCGSVDPIDEIGLICEKYGIWFHVNGSYGGTAMICPEYKHFLKGIEYAQSFNISPSEWMLVQVDCDVVFVKDKFKMIETSVDRTLIGYSFLERYWVIPSGTEFTAMQLWAVMRAYGVEGLQKHIRSHIQLAKIFEDCVKRDKRFEVVFRNWGLVCFRLIGPDVLNKCLLTAINSSGNLFMTPCWLKEKYVLRFFVCKEDANEKEITDAWTIICKYTEEVLEKRELLEKGSEAELFVSPYQFWLP